MRTPHRILAIAAATLVAGGAAVAIGLTAGDETSSQRQQVVAQRGARVMPFDLNATTHHFVTQSYGGRQIVVADRPNDRRQVELIQQHLRKEARAFARGDFDDPAAIHGSTMPGLATLRSAANKLSIKVQDRADGAQLTFRTTDAHVKDALHDWFDAQENDHGTHAETN